MEILLYKERDNKVSRWSGGITRQLAIFPEDRVFANRDFGWRLSTAEVEKEETEFTHFPLYDRILMVLEGEVILSFEGERVSRLRRLEQDRFGGEVKTRSFGLIRDFNLIYRKGGDAYLEAQELVQEARPLAEETHLSDEYEMESRFFYCFNGYSVLLINGKEHVLKEGDTLVVHGKPEEKVAFQAMGRGTLIHGIVRYQEVPPAEEIGESTESGSESEGGDGGGESCKKPPSYTGGGTLDDLKMAAYLSLTNFRGSRYLFKGRREYWNDPVLAEAIGRLERSMATFLLGMVGVVTTAIVAERMWGLDHVLPSILLWVLIDIFLINPLIYFFLMPKPIRSHRKKISELTREEKEHHEASCRVNPQAEKILKKYTITGRNKYNDE
jgi:environmental stress-induced protein Ves